MSLRFLLHLVSIGIKDGKLSKIECNNITINQQEMQASMFVRDLGVWLDCELKMYVHVYHVVRVCLTNLRKLWSMNSSIGNVLSTAHAIKLHDFRQPLFMGFQGANEIQREKVLFSLCH